MRRYGKISTVLSYRHIPLLLVLFAAALLRLWAFAQLPFTHDEFSALFRTHYETFGSLVREGIMADAHPAGVQLFLWYWVKIFGFNEFWIKLPFAIMGIASVWLVYLIGRAWFNETAGLFAAAMVAMMQFFVLYSQLARPYAAGLFAVLLMVHLWSRLLLRPKNHSWEWVLFAVSLTLSALMHAFSTLLAGMIFFSGLFLFKGGKLRTYLLSGFLALLLYAPHIPIFWHQLSRGSIGGWLGLPEPSFIFEFAFYIFHYDLFFVIVSGLAVMALFSLHSITWLQQNQLRLHGLAWFIATYLIAYYYSVYRVPVLQFSTLFFAIPFLLLFFASFIRKLNWSGNLAMVVVILLIGINGLVNKRHHYELMYKQGFDQIALHLSGDNLEFGERLQVVVRPASPRMQSFYLEEEGVEDVTLFSGSDNAGMLFQHLDTANTKQYLAFGWTDYAPLEWVEVARDFYPYIVKYRNWFNSEYYLLSNNQQDTLQRLLPEEKCIVNMMLEKDEGKFESSRQYGQLLSITSDSVAAEGYNIVMVSAMIRALDTVAKLNLVLELRDAVSNDLLHWQSGGLYEIALMPGHIRRLHSTLRLDGLKLPNKPYIIRCYLWNPDGYTFQQLDHTIRLRRQDRRILGLYEAM